MSDLEDPFTDAPPAEVLLERAPLVRVIAQVRFPEILMVEQREFVAPFQEAIRATYPVLRQEQTQGVLLTPVGSTPVKPQTAWRFTDIPGSWRVSLTPEFLALETTRYRDQADFIARLDVLVRVLDDCIQPRLVDRLGLRYINRIFGRELEDLPLLVRPEVRGILGTRAAERASHTICETMFEHDDAKLLARWGRLSPGTTVDPSAVEPSPEPSWLLDLDMFDPRALPFSAERIVADARRFHRHIHSLFRWAVQDEFLRRFGGSP